MQLCLNEARTLYALNSSTHVLTGVEVCSTHVQARSTHWCRFTQCSLTQYSPCYSTQYSLSKYVVLTGVELFIYIYIYIYMVLTHVEVLSTHWCEGVQYALSRCVVLTGVEVCSTHSPGM